MEEDKLKTLWENMGKKVPGFTVGYDQFKTDMQNEENLKRLHGNLPKYFDGFAVPYDQFKTDMGVVAPVVEKKSPDQSAVSAPPVSQVGGPSGQPIAQAEIGAVVTPQQEAPQAAQPIKLYSKNSKKIYPITVDQISEAYKGIGQQQFGKPWEELDYEQRAQAKQTLMQQFQRDYEDATPWTPAHEKLMTGDPSALEYAAAAGSEFVQQGISGAFDVAKTPQTVATQFTMPKLSNYSEEFATKTGGDLEKAVQVWLSQPYSGKESYDKTVQGRFQKYGEGDTDEWGNILFSVGENPLSYASKKPLPSEVFGDMEKRLTEKYDSHIANLSAALFEAQDKGDQVAIDRAKADINAYTDGTEFKTIEALKELKKKAQSEESGNIKEMKGSGVYAIEKSFEDYQKSLQKEMATEELSAAGFANRAMVAGLPMTEELRKSKPAQYGGAVASMASMVVPDVIATGVFHAPPGLTSSLIGASQSYTSAYNEALQRGANPAQAAEDAYTHGVIGLSEGIPIGGWMNRLDRATGGAAKKSFLGALQKVGSGALTMGSQGSQEFAQEFFTQIAGNMSSKDIWDKSRNIMEGAKDAGEIGFVLGAIMGAAEIKRSNAPIAEQNEIKEAQENILKWVDEQLAKAESDLRANPSAENAIELASVIEERKNIENKRRAMQSAPATAEAAPVVRENQTTEQPAEVVETTETEVTETPEEPVEAPVAPEPRTPQQPYRETVINQLYGRTNQQGVSSEVGVRQEPVQTELDQSAGAQEAGAGGMVQTPLQEVLDRPASEVDIDTLIEEQSIPAIQDAAKEAGIQISEDETEMVYDALQQKMEDNPDRTVKELLDETLTDYKALEGVERPSFELRAESYRILRSEFEKSKFKTTPTSLKTTTQKTTPKKPSKPKSQPASTPREAAMQYFAEGGKVNSKLKSTTGNITEAKETAWNRSESGLSVDAIREQLMADHPNWDEKEVTEAVLEAMNLSKDDLKAEMSKSARVMSEEEYFRGKEPSAADMKAVDDFVKKAGGITKVDPKKATGLSKEAQEELKYRVEEHKAEMAKPVPPTVQEWRDTKARLEADLKAANAALTKAKKAYIASSSGNKTALNKAEAAQKEAHAKLSDHLRTEQAAIEAGKKQTNILEEKPNDTVPFQEGAPSGVKLTKAQVDAAMVVFDAMADEWAAQTGNTRDDFYKNVKISTDPKDFAIDPKDLARGVKGAYFRASDGTHMIGLFENADVSTILHEFAHMGRNLIAEMAKVDPKWKTRYAELTKWAGADGKYGWNEKAEEKFARGFERYMRTGSLPVDAPLGIRRVFDSIKNVMKRIYKNIADGVLGAKLPPQIVSTFDAMLGIDSGRPRKEKPATTSETPTLKPPTTAEKKVISRAYRGQTNEQVRTALAKHGLTRKRIPHAESAQIAKDIIDEIGIDEAVKRVTTPQPEGLGIAGAPGTAIVAAKIDQLQTQAAEAQTEEEVSALIEEQAALVNWLSKNATEAGQANSMLAYIYATSDFRFDYTPAAQIEQYKQRNGGEISPEIQQQFNELADKLKALEERERQLEAKVAEAEDQLLISNIAEALERESGTPSGKKKGKEIADKIRKAKLVRPGMFAASSPGAIVWDTAVELTAKAVEAGGILSDAITKGISHIKNSDWYKKLSTSDQEAAEKEFAKAMSKANPKPKEATVDEKGRIRVPNSLIKYYVSQGIRDMEDLVRAIKKDLIEEHPEITERRIRDAISKYGKTSNLSPEEIDEQIRKMKRIGRITSALEDIANKKRPLRSGLQRDKPGPDERLLNRQLKEAIEDLPMDEETEAKELKTALDAVKTRLNNAIEDLNREIATGERKPRPKGVEYDAEAKALAAERDRLKEERDAIFGEEITDEERIRTAIKQTESAIKALADRIAKGELEREAKPQVTSPELQAKREELQKLRDEMKQLQEAAGIPEKRRLEAAKKAAAKKLEEYQTRLKNKDYSKRKPNPKAVPDAELLAVRAAIVGVKDEFDTLQYKAELKNRSKARKIGDALFEIWNLTRALRATMEFSFMFIQGGKMTVAHPIIAATKAVPNMLRQMASEKAQKQWLQNIRAQDFYARMKASKLALTEPDAKLNAKEELFVSGWTSAIWDLMSIPAKKVLGQKAGQAVKAINPFRAFERAGTAYMNTLRTERYLQGEKMLEKQDKNFRDNPEDYKNMADVINTLTGRASLGPFERGSKLLAAIFFSPRMWASTIKTMTPYAFYHFGKMGTRNEAGRAQVSVAQKMALSDWMKFTTFTASMVLLAAAYFNNDDDDETGVDFDPTSPDFMKIKLGNTRIDPWGGAVQMVVYQMRVLNHITTLATGEDDVIGKRTPAGAKGTPFALTTSMVTNKLAPSASLLYKYSDAKLSKDKKTKDEVITDQFGKPLNEEVVKSFYPIYVDTVRELWKDQPTEVAAFLTAMSALGLGVNTYPDKKKGKK